MQYLVVKLAAGPVPAAAGSSSTCTADSCVQYKLSVDAIRAQPGSMLADLLAMGNGAAGLSLAMQDD